MSLWNSKTQDITHCAKCGLRLASKESGVEYSIFTGDRKAGITLYCPRFKFEVFSHYTREFDSAGNELTYHDY